MNHNKNQEIWHRLDLKTGDLVSIGPPKLPDVADITELLSNIANEDNSIPISESTVTAQGVKEMILKMQKTDDFDLLVASVKEKIIAFAEMEKGKLSTSKIGIAVDMKYRRMGIGKAMVELLEEKARNSQIQKITLFVPFNNLGAIKFYRELGFDDQSTKSETRRRNSITPLGALQMSKPVHPRSTS